MILAKEVNHEPVAKGFVSFTLCIQFLPCAANQISSSIHRFTIDALSPIFSFQENSAVGTSILELIMSDRDSPENGPPYSFQILEGNERKAFQINQDGLLVTSSVLNRRIKEQYLLQVQVD